MKMIHRDTREIRELEELEELAFEVWNSLPENMFVPIRGFKIGYVFGLGWEIYDRPVVPVTLHTRPDCSQCDRLKRALDGQKITFEIDSDSDSLLRVAAETGITSAPILDVDGRRFEFTEALRRLVEIKAFVKGELTELL